MKTITKIPFGRIPACIALILLASFFLNGCSENEKPEPQKELPVVATSAVSEITENSAKAGGNVTSDGGAAVTARGVVWSAAPNPTLADSKTTNGVGTGEFVAELITLEAGTTYYVRAYATNSEGTAYGDPVSFETESAIGSVTDIDGNEYATIKIGNQVWMAENLRTTRYNDGTNIPNAMSNTEWYEFSVELTTGAYSVPSSEYDAVFGKLYNWYAVGTNKLCPPGWSIPSDGQWTQLANYLGGNANNAGGKMKSTGNHTDGTGLWYSPNTGATNVSGFTGLPGGYRHFIGYFEYIATTVSGGYYGYYGFWWSSTQNPASGPEYAWGTHISYENGNTYRGGNKGHGFSCRCIKD